MDWFPRKKSYRALFCNLRAPLNIPMAVIPGLTRDPGSLVESGGLDSGSEPFDRLRANGLS